MDSHTGKPSTLSLIEEMTCSFSAGSFGAR
jgi:hypothetical protein